VFIQGAIVPWLTRKWQHQGLYGKAYLCKAGVMAAVYAQKVKIDADR
jgi:hypothetical protein